MEQHILIIDDDTTELRKLRELLTRGGYNIMTATDKDTAERIMKRIPVGFLLVKASMWESAGEALAEARATQLTSTAKGKTQ
jgi:DNA-binding response OmpR family regulator